MPSDLQSLGVREVKVALYRDLCYCSSTDCNPLPLRKVSPSGCVSPAGGFLVL